MSFFLFLFLFPFRVGDWNDVEFCHQQVADADPMGGHEVGAGHHHRGVRVGECILLLVHVWTIGLTSCVLVIAGSRAQHGGYGAAAGGGRGGGRGVLQDS